MRCITFFLAVAMPAMAFSQPGTLDNSFDADGIVTTDLGSLTDEAEAVVVQPDGKIIVTGFTGDGLLVDFAVARYNPDGSPDATFGIGGVVITDIDSSYQIALDVALDEQGRILVCGWTVAADGAYDIAVVRYLPDGTLDGGFDFDGVVTTAVGGFNESDQAYAMAIQPDGKIVVAGSTNDWTLDRFCVVRYDTDGSLDSTFSGDGKLVTELIPTWPSLAHAVAIQPDGKIIAAGWSQGFALVRYTTSGDLDSTFGVNGLVTTGVVGNAYDIALQPDDKILVTGAVGGGVFSCVTARYLSDGSLDASFGTGGQVVTMVDANSLAVGVLLQPDGRIVITGYTCCQFMLVRYESDGSLDGSFGTGGMVYPPIASFYSNSFGSALQPDGKILLCGRADNGSGLDFGVARYLTGLNIGLAEFSENSNTVLLYPNPLTDEAVLEYGLATAGELSCELVDAQGRSVCTLFSNAHRSAGSHREALDLSGFAAGHYTLVLSNGEGRMSVRVVKE